MPRGCSEQTWLLEEGQIPKPCQAASLILAPSIPQISADSREVFPPAYTDSSTTQEKSSPASAARAGGGRREKAPGRREHIWNQLESTECLGKNCRAGRNHSESRVLGRDSEAKVENETYAAYLNTKPELLLRLWGFFHASS